MSNIIEPGNNTVTYTGTIETFTVETSGTYDITAFGAQGGADSAGDAGGNGAEISGTFTLTAGEVLTIAVGGAGGAGTANEGYGGGGGGGTFVLETNNGSQAVLNKLVIAGGGGGAFYSGNPTSPGQTTTSGASGYHGGAGGTGGSGGGYANTGNSPGAGGGGFSGAGVGGGGAYGGGGYGAANGNLAGGKGGVEEFGHAGNGGFGGGGGGGRIFGGGGGGGYSGGGGGQIGGPNSHGGGGGGSYDGGTNQTLIAGENAGNGEVTIDLVPLCFLRGTRIMTATGEVAVEHLAIGDPVVTGSGIRPIVWIGTGRVLATRFRRTAATPVIVRKNALGDNVPKRDLHVTKAHSLYVDGVLIPVEFLVNHRSILWDDQAKEVEIYHVELDSHDVLLANGALAESYRDDGNRWLFQNANSGWHLPPQEPCAPVLTGGSIVDAVWKRLLDRTGRPARVPLTGDPDLHLLVDGTRVDSTMRHGDSHAFTLPRAPSEVRIISRSASPQELGLARDPRCLGVAVRRVVVRQGDRFRTFRPDDMPATDGFHAFEANERFSWTDGDALLPPAMFAGLTGPVEIVLHIGSTTQYVEDGIATRVA